MEKDIKNFSFRLAGLQDAEIILRLFREVSKLDNCDWNDDYPNMHFVENDIRNQNLYVYCNEDSEIIGTISVEPGINESESGLKWSDDFPAATLSRMCIAPSYQGMGLSHVILAFSCDIAVERGYGYCRILFSKANPQAVKLYTNKGYNKIGEAQLYSSDFIAFEVLL